MNENVKIAEENFRLYVIGVLHEIDTPYNLHATADDIGRWQEDAIRRYRNDPSFHHRVDSICAAAPSALRSHAQPLSTNDVPIETKLVVKPESLQKLAAWFDSPNTCKNAVEVFIPHSERPYHSAGYLLRRIADALSKQLDEGGKP